MTALELFEAKVRTGAYNHYNEAQLARLYMDCKIQVEQMNRCNKEVKVKND